MKTSEPTAIVFYGDINAFTNWTRRVPHDRPADVLRETYDIYDLWAHNCGFWIKKQFDGFIAVKEFHPTENRDEVLGAIRDAQTITTTMNRYLSHLTYPRPTLFRMRGAFGTVWRLTEDSPKVDYGGDAMVLGRRMLDYLKTTQFIVSEGVFDAIGRRGCEHFRFRKIHLPKRLVGIDIEDQRAFFCVQFL